MSRHAIDRCATCLVALGLVYAVHAYAQQDDGDDGRAVVAAAFGPGETGTLNPQREAWYRRFQIVAAVDAKPGMRVALIGAVDPVFKRLFADKVGDAGEVLAVGASQDAVASGLAAGSIDRAFLCDTYHQLAQPQAALGAIGRALKRDGRLVVIDYRRIAGVSPQWVMDRVARGESEVKAEIESAGFRLLTDSDMLEFNYFLVFAPPA